jgi:hypothetical protein
MRLDMGQIDCLQNTCQQWVEGYVQINNAKLQYKEYQVALKFNVQDVRNACALNVQLIR